MLQKYKCIKYIDASPLNITNDLKTENALQKFPKYVFLTELKFLLLAMNFSTTLEFILLYIVFFFRLCSRNTSCSHGWLRLVVQCIFCVITVASFVLIVFLSFTSSRKPQPVSPRCFHHGCRVICNKTPFYGDFEENILLTVSVRFPFFFWLLFTDYPFRTI